MQNRNLKPILITGLILALLISWGLVFAIIFFGNNPGINSVAMEMNFRQELNFYDQLDAPRRILDGENPAQIEMHLASLQGKAVSVEEHLSVLKRRRVLASIDRRYIAPYERAAQESLSMHPHSAPLTAVVMEALIMGGIDFRGMQGEVLTYYAQNLSQPRFSLAELGLWVLSGEMDNPVGAANIPSINLLLSQDLSPLPPALRERLMVNEFLLNVYQGNTSRASLLVNLLLSAPPSPGYREIQRMGAEYFYDHGNFLRAAELFSRLDDERDHALAASALALAGEIGGARNIWLTLAGQETSAQIRARSFYNLGSTAPGLGESITWIESFLAQTQGITDRARTYSIIRYTRLLDMERSIAILEDSEMRQNPLLDLELLRLQINSLPQRRAQADTWLLLERHPESEALYEWAAWYFDLQRFYSESSRLILEAGRNGMSGEWMELHRGLALIREGRINEGEAILAENIGHSTNWRFNANMGRVQEGRRSISSALSYYEAAALLVTDRADAAQIQLRISRCLEALGRISESRRALQYALELDPDNLHIHRELRNF